MFSFIRHKFANITGVSLITVIATMTWYTAYEQFSASLYANAISTSLNTINDMDSSQHHDALSNANVLAQQLIDSKPSSAHHYELIHLLQQWNNFSLGVGAVIESNWLLEQSTQRRPTWPITYVEKAKILILEKSPHKEIEQQIDLAAKYGPVHPKVQLMQIKYGFERWESLLPQSRAALAIQLLKFNKNYRHKSQLNHMIQYSPAAQRMCNLFKFNNIQVTSCQ